MRNRRLSQRPENFRLDYDHELGKDLIFAGLNGNKGSLKYQDYSRYGKHGLLTTMTPSSDWVYSPQLGRFALKFNDIGKVVCTALAGNASICTISLWAQRNTIIDGYSVILGGSAPYKDAIWVYENGMIGFGDGGANWSNWGTGTWMDKTSFHHIACVVYNNDIGINTRLYFDGVDKGLCVGTAQIHGIFDTLTLGCYAAEYSYKWVGQISDVLIYRSILSQNAIQKLANAADPMLDGLLQYPKRQIFPGYTFNTTAPTTYVARQHPYTKINKRSDDSIIDQNHYLANGLIFAGCGKSPGSAAYVDGSIYQTNGILTSMTPVIDWVWDDKIGQWVLDFDGFDDYVSVASVPSFRLAGDKSLCCWVKMPSLSTGCGFAGKSNSIAYGMALGYGWNGNGFMALCWNSNNAPAIVRDATRDYEWCHLSAVQQGTYRYIYVWDKQGLRTAFVASGGTHSWDHADPFRIGDAGAQKPPVGTQIGSVLVYNRAISLAETKVLSNPYDPMMDGLLRPAKRKLYAGIYIAPSISSTIEVPDTSSKVIVRRRGRKLTERPETFNVDYNNPLAHGLVFGALLNSPGSKYTSDSSIYNTAGTLINVNPTTNIKWSSQLHRRYFQFTAASTHYSTHPARSQYNLVKQGTIAFWARADLLDNSLQDCILKGGAAWVNNDWSIFFRNNRYYGNIANGVTSLGGGGGGNETPVITDSINFYHICFTWNANYAPTIIKMYFNGILCSNLTTSIVPTDRIYTFGFGRDNEFDGYYFPGGMADIMLYNRDLTALEVNQLGDASNTMLSDMLQSPKRQYYPVYSSPNLQTISRARFLRLSTYNRRSLLLWKR